MSGFDARAYGRTAARTGDPGDVIADGTEVTDREGAKGVAVLVDRAAQVALVSFGSQGSRWRCLEDLEVSGKEGP